MRLSLKVFHTRFSTSALYNGRYLVGYEVIITNSRYALVGYFITSYPTRAHGIIVIYFHAKWRLFFVYLSGNVTILRSEQFSVSKDRGVL